MREKSETSQYYNDKYRKLSCTHPFHLIQLNKAQSKKPDNHRSAARIEKCLGATVQVTSDADPPPRLPSHLTNAPSTNHFPHSIPKIILATRSNKSGTLLAPVASGYPASHVSIAHVHSHVTN